MSILVTGGTGFVGKRLLNQIQDPTLITRNAGRAEQNFVGHPASPKFIQWKSHHDQLVLPDSGFRQVVHLMGESIAEGRWTEAKKERIRSSRVDATNRLVEALLKTEKLPETFVSASAIGIYGDPGEEGVDESSPHGTGYLTEVCQEWEESALRLVESGVRVVCLRIGIVLGREGGAMEKMVPLFRWGLGGRLGNGKQWVAWIHVEDLVAMILWALNDSNVSGPVNATAPNPVRNKELTKVLAKSVNRPALFPAPKFMLRVVLGEFANSLFFSQKVLPTVALENGFQFQFPEINQAISEVVS